jgi:hypothetical protein
MEYLDRTFFLFELKVYGKNEIIIEKKNIISNKIFVIIDGNVVSDENN